MKRQRICILGGTGFIGSHLAGRLVRDGAQVELATRQRERHRDLLVLPTLEVVEVNIFDDQALAEFVDGADVVINLVGILNENRKGDFAKIHTDLPKRVAQACADKGVPRYLHMGALNADAENGSSEYLKSKGAGEAALKAFEDKVAITTFRPSVIFGRGDSFFNRFSSLLGISPVFLPLACGQARFAPVYVGDVVEAMVRSISNKATFGQSYNLCGPDVYTLVQLVELANKWGGHGKQIIQLNDGFSRLQARVMEFVPGKPFSRDNYNSLKTDAICSKPFPQIFGITPHTLEAVVPGYLGRGASQQRFDDSRADARHEY